MHKSLFRIDKVGCHSTRGNLRKRDERWLKYIRLECFQISLSFILMCGFTHQSIFQFMFIKWSHFLQTPDGIHRHGGEHTSDNFHCRNTCGVIMEVYDLGIDETHEKIVRGQTCNPGTEQSARRLWGRQPEGQSYSNSSTWIGHLDIHHQQIVCIKKER